MITIEIEIENTKEFNPALEAVAKVFDRGFMAPISFVIKSKVKSGSRVSGKKSKYINFKI